MAKTRLESLPHYSEKAKRQRGQMGHRGLNYELYIKKLLSHYSRTATTHINQNSYQKIKIYTLKLIPINSLDFQGKLVN